MRDIVISLVLVAVTALSALSLHARADDVRDSRIEEWRALTKNGKHDELIRSALAVYENAEETQDWRLKESAGIYLSQAYLATGKYDSVYYYLDAVEEGVETGTDIGLKIIMNNVKAILAVSVEMNYADAFKYFQLALNLSEENDMPYQKPLLLCNIAHLYEIRNDTTGFSYAKQAYDICKTSGDTYILPSAIILLSQMYSLKGEYGEAMKYAEELMSVSDAANNVSYRQIAYQLMGMIYENEGCNEDARRSYDSALLLNDNVDDYSAKISIYLAYGNFLRNMGDMEAARKMFETGLKMAMDRRSVESIGGFLFGLSDVCAKTGDSVAAYGYYCQYDILQQQKANSEREFNRLWIRYETLRHQKEISEKELDLIRANQLIFAGALVLAVLIVIIAVIFYLYKKKNRMYRQLVENHYRMSSAMVKETAHKDCGSGGLYDRIEELMVKDKVYRQKDISLDKLASLLNTNRSYISKEINTCSGMSFYNYINHYRIKETVEILQDTENDIPLKALCEDLGFNSVSVFYRSFQKETGVPPSRYREEVRRIKEEEKKKFPLR